MDFSGKSAIVTGGVQGMGRAFVSALLERGMKVCVCDVQDSQEVLMNSLPEDQKQRTIFHRGDVSSFSDFEGAFKKTISTFGRVDLVVNNAGILNEHEWKKMIGVNFVGTINGIKLALEYMDVNKGGNGGNVICIGSNVSFESFDLGPIYSGCKHAVIGLVKGYGSPYHLEKTGVKVNAVCPGAIDTPLFHCFHKGTIDEEQAIKLSKTKILIKPEIVAKAVVKVLEDGRNGALLRVDDEGMRYV